MKVTIGATGQLTIAPESDIENYALSKWWDDWQDKKVVLSVEVQHPHTPGAKTVHSVSPD